MMTNSYLEYFLTLLAWVVNNGLWSVLTSTGLFALPLVFKVLGIWLKVREEGEDEGNKGSLAIVRIENALYGAFVVILFCCVPLMEVSVSTLQFDTSRTKTCGTWTPVKPRNPVTAAWCRHWIIRQPKSRCGGCWYISCRKG